MQFYKYIQEAEQHKKIVNMSRIPSVFSFLALVACVLCAWSVKVAALLPQEEISKNEVSVDEPLEFTLAAVEEERSPNLAEVTPEERAWPPAAMAALALELAYG